MAAKKGFKNFLTRIAHWGGLITGNILLLIFIIFLIGEGVPKISFTRTDLLSRGSLILAFAGILAGWKWDKLAGIMILSGILIFYLNHYISIGRFPGGWVFPLFYLAGSLHLVAGWKK
jgi:hypothetical protein